MVTAKNGKWSYLGVAGGQWTILIDAAGFKGAEGSAQANEFGPAPAIRVTMQRPAPEELRRAAEQGALGAVKRGNELMAAEKWAEARAEYEKALADLEPASQPAVLRGIARTCFQEGQKDRAIAELEKALAIAPDDPDTLRLIISLLVAQGREPEAEAYMARLPQGTGIDPNTLLNLGISHYNAGEYAPAVAEFDRAVTENPSLPEAYYYRGLAYLAMGKNAEAKADFAKLVALDPDGKLAGEAREFLKSLSGGS
jgi:tetratricopeptide (TPR) repeat protein